MLSTDHLPGRTLLLDGREYRYFSGTSYLGIARNPAFAALLAEGMRQYGTNFSGSRQSNLQLRVYAEAEAHLAHFTGAEAALTMSSGYLAGQMAARTLRQQLPGAAFFYAPGTHPAVWLDDYASFAPNFAAWAAGIGAMVASCPAREVVLVANALNPLLAQRHDFGWVSQLPTTHRITLLLDDSHGLGVTGKGGAGIFSQIVLPSHGRLVVISSLGKALGIPGGVVLGEAALVDALRQSPFFGAGSPIVPAYFYAYLRADALYDEARAQLLANVRQFAARALPLGLFHTFADYPVFYAPRNELYEYFKSRDAWVSSFAYPTPRDAHVTRVVLSALHTAEDVDFLATLAENWTAHE